MRRAPLRASPRPSSRVGVNPPRDDGGNAPLRAPNTKVATQAEVPRVSLRAPNTSQRDGDDFIQEYLDHLRVERGLAENSIIAYGHDLARLAAHARARRKHVLDLRLRDLTDFIARLREGGLSARSAARAVHAVRGLYRFAVRESRIDADPMENLKAPRAFPALPRYLATAQVDALLAAPDVATPLGIRDRAILEVLYATGLRVSELIGLRPGDVDMPVGVLTCFGKGRK